MSDKQIKIKQRLYEVNVAIGHWHSVKNKAEHYLDARLREKSKLEKELEDV
jgi:hypothetical protein